MNSTRLEAFSDGVNRHHHHHHGAGAQVPHGETADALEPLIPNFLSYVLSFIYVGIYWNNHHHMLHTVEKVSGRILWANLHLLFWLSLFPITTAWIGENHLAAMPSALYGVVLLMASLAYWILQQLIIASQGPDSLLKRAIGGDWKGKASPVLYSIGIAAAFRSPPLAQGLYLLVALMWFRSGPPHRERAGSQIDLTGELSCPSRHRGRVETWHTDPGLCDASFLRGDNRLEYGT